jgi:uncharacterized protein
MPRRRSLNFLAATCVFTALLLLESAAQASARLLTPAPPDSPQFSAPAIRIPASAPSVGGRKSKAQVSDSGPLPLKTTNTLPMPILESTTCPAEPSGPAGPENAGPSRPIAALTPLERLRATASGTVLTENRQLSKERHQRLQANAAWQMGLLTLHGICMSLNTADAAVWFERAQKLGEPLAPAGLAWCEIEGCKAAANPAAAGKWVELLRRVDAPRAMYLQWLMQSRLAPLEIPPPTLARLGQQLSIPPVQNRQLLASAAQLGDTNAKIEMGLDSVYANRPEEALAFFKSAAQKSSAANINSSVIAERLSTSARLPPANRASAVAPVKPQSAAENLAQAQRYHRGTGVPSNYTEAVRLYQLAKNQGSVEARKMLELIFSRPGADGQIDLAWMQQLAQVDLSTPQPKVESHNIRQNLKREPTPLFELVRQPWRKYSVASVNA